MIKVLIVDDSALMQQLLTTILQSDPEIEVVGTAEDPYVAREKIKLLNPDVITLDVEMPRMDGLTFLQKIMQLRPMPVIMFSSLTQRGAGITMQALEIGAVEALGKPADSQNIGSLSDELIAKVKGAAKAHVKPRAAHQVIPVKMSRYSGPPGRLIAIGSSTGGVEALREILTVLPANSPPIAIVQHISAGFTNAFAKRLNSLSTITVVEAENGMPLKTGYAYIAPDTHHLCIERNEYHWQCCLEDGPPVSSHKPSIDMLFHSIAKYVGDKGTGAILTGMGRDGGAGLKAMRIAGARTLGQDAESCVVYGMPRYAREIGAVECEVTLARMAESLLYPPLIRETFHASSS